MKIYKIATVTSEDCVAKIIGLYPETKASDWKRRSKTSVFNGRIIRTFENIKNGKMVEVEEITLGDGQTLFDVRPVSVVPDQAPDKSKTGVPKSKNVYGWATKRTPSSEEHLDGYLVIAPRGNYSSAYYDDDDGTIAKILMDNNFYPEDETNVEIPRGKKSELQTLLNTNPQLRSLLQYDAGFQRFLNTEDYGPYEFEYDKP